MQGPLVTDGVCPQDGVPSVSSINRIVRNKVVERVCKSEYEDLEPLLDTKHKLAPSSYSINRILGQHAHLSPAPALKRKWSEDAKAAADSGGKREYVGQYTSGQPAPAMEIKWDQDPPHLLLPPAPAPPHYSSVSPLPPVSASLFESINTIQYPGRPAPPRPAWTPPWASSPPCRSSRRSHRSTQRTKTHLLTQVPSCNQSIKSKYFSTFICCIHVKTF